MQLAVLMSLLSTYLKLSAAGTPPLRDMHYDQLWPDQPCYWPQNNCFHPYTWGQSDTVYLEPDAGVLLNGRDDGGVDFFGDPEICTVLAGGDKQRYRECLKIRRVRPW